MRLPFSRGPRLGDGDPEFDQPAGFDNDHDPDLDDLDFGDLDDLDVPDPGAFSSLDANEAHKAATSKGLRHRLGRRNATLRAEGEVSADEFVDQMERLRSEASAEQRTAWAYLGVLTGVFLFLVLFGYGCSDQGANEVATGEAREVLESVNPRAWCSGSMATSSPSKAPCRTRPPSNNSWLPPRPPTVPRT